MNSVIMNFFQFRHQISLWRVVYLKFDTLAFAEVRRTLWMKGLVMAQIEENAHETAIDKHLFSSITLASGLPRL
jgi:hypothetical protein